MVDFTEIRELLRLAREETGLTLDEAAAKSGLNRATIHSIENVKREPVLRSKIPTYEKLAAAYGRTLSLSFAPIKGLSRPVGLSKNVPSLVVVKGKTSDEALSTPSEETIDPSDAATYRALGKLFGRYAEPPYPHAGPVDHRQAADRRHEKSEDDRKNRAPRRRRHRRKPSRRRVDSDKE